jgi:hypothetical protein
MLPLALTVAGALATLAACTMSEAGPRSAALGFWFEPVSYASPVLDGSITPGDMAIIETMARAELATAFQGMNITVSDRRDAKYGVQVVQDLLDERVTTRKVSVAGESRVVTGFGGRGAVNFTYMASAAVVYAPAAASRGEIIEAIGRGIGRAAVHEFAHQLLPDAPIDGTPDRLSYEYGAASRPEQYFGTLHWDLAGPLLAARFKSSP